MQLIEFAHLSKRNEIYPKKTVRVANGAEFVYLDIPHQDKLNAANVLYLHLNLQGIFFLLLILTNHHLKT